MIMIVSVTVFSVVVAIIKHRRVKHHRLMADAGMGVTGSDRILVDDATKDTSKVAGNHDRHTHEKFAHAGFVSELSKDRRHCKSNQQQCWNDGQFYQVRRQPKEARRMVPFGIIEKALWENSKIPFVAVFNGFNA